MSCFPIMGCEAGGAINYSYVSPDEFPLKYSGRERPGGLDFLGTLHHAVAVKFGFSRRLSESRGAEHPLTQEIKFCPPVHATLDQLETVDVAFEQAI